MLAKHWPSADRSVCDVHEAGSGSLVRPWLICGGFPCQDVSSAGKRRGLEGKRSGLWFEYHRIVDELRPAWVVVENVASGAAAWLPEVRQGLCELGYSSAAVAVAALDMGAPHRRRRIFVLANCNGHRLEGEREPLQGGEHDGQQRNEPHGCGGQGGMADTDSERLRLEQQRRSGGWARGVRDEGQAFASCDGEDQPSPHSESGVGRAADGVPPGVDRWPAARGEPQRWFEPPRSGRPPGGGQWHARLRALGNAVVPACAWAVGRMIDEAERRGPREGTEHDG